MKEYFDVAFTDPVKDLQRTKGARDHYVKMAPRWPAPTTLGGQERAHITSRDSFYLASVGETGWPYVQHRGGATGFVTVIDDRTIGWVEQRGNRQYIGTGNITGDDRVALIMLDYPSRTRLKLYGHATYHPFPSADLLAALQGQDLRADGAVTVVVVSYDWNCPKYITPRFTADQVRIVTDPLQARIEELEASVEELEAERARLLGRFQGLTCD